MLEKTVVFRPTVFDQQRPVPPTKMETALRVEISAESSYYWTYWCPEGDLNPHRPFSPADFKSAASANFAIRALGAGVTRSLNKLRVILPCAPTKHYHIAAAVSLRLPCEPVCRLHGSVQARVFAKPIAY